MKHPYENLKSYNFWSKSMSSPAPGHIDPVTRFSLIQPHEKISTMGSCFAQHLSRNIVKSGFNYYISEHGDIFMNENEYKRKNYGIFSARYGNIYTVRQAVQLFDRAFYLFIPNENIWNSNNRYYDAFRPQVEPDGFSSKNELLNDRLKHLSAVRDIFTKSDWLIFTLGLTEAWKSKEDNSIFPVAPGVSSGIFDKDRHEFINFDYSETIADLREFVSKVNSVNPKIKLLLTVSPVPLIATYEDRHVLVSTTVSKSILRAASDKIEKEFSNIIYFPSYEIITSSANSGKYFHPDLRQVTDVGVNHVMRMFTKHFLQHESTANNICNSTSYEIRPSQEIVCDEDLIESAIKKYNI